MAVIDRRHFESCRRRHVLSTTRRRLGFTFHAASLTISKPGLRKVWGQQAHRPLGSMLVSIGCVLFAFVLLSTADVVSGHGLAVAGAPGAGKSRTMTPGKSGERDWNRDRSSEKLPWADDDIKVPAAEVWTFCQTQRRTCVRICATFFRGRASCTQSCRNLSQGCVSGGCFHWKRNLWRLAAHHQARYCVR